MILDVLKFRVQVLHTDVDVVFLNNPLDDLKRTIQDNSDFAVLLDHSALNAGFILVKPTPGSIAVYTKIHEIGPSVPDQIALNEVTEKYRHTLKFTVLDVEKYQCGKQYWEIGARTFIGDNPCSDCMVVHNNWIVTNEAKTYR